MVITIDGPAGAGKSTVARRLAKKLGFLYIDSGAMYRALTLKAMRSCADFDNDKEIILLAQTTTIILRENNKDELEILLDGKDVTREIRMPSLTNAVCKIARIPQIREIMAGWQRAYAQTDDVVMEGRDIGTVVFSKAEKKFYLDADFAERAKRRFKELEEKGIGLPLKEVVHQIKERDDADRARSHGPLKKADDAILIDSTRMTIEEVVDAMYEKIRP